jgi:hypothetical protein
MVVMTQDIMDAAKSRHGGWSNAQFRALGVFKFTPKGWKKQLIGKEYTENAMQEFLDLRNKHLTGKPCRKKRSKFKNKKVRFIPVAEPLTWKEQYRHPNWQRRRLQILERDKFTCRRCGDKDSMLHVHHLKYRKNSYIWEAKGKDMITLCEKCHDEEHGK